MLKLLTNKRMPTDLFCVVEFKGEFIGKEIIFGLAWTGNFSLTPIRIHAMNTSNESYVRKATMTVVFHRVFCRMCAFWVNKNIYEQMNNISFKTKLLEMIRAAYEK